MTGYMTVAGGKKHPFNVFKDGKIVAWAIDLSKPADTKKAPSGPTSPASSRTRNGASTPRRAWPC